MASDGHTPEPGKQEVATTAAGSGLNDLADPQFMCCVCLWPQFFFSDSGDSSVRWVRNEDSKTSPPQEVLLNGSTLDEHSKKVKLDDVSCPLCKEMLYQPGVLNCGHVYCVSCLSSSNEEALKCHVCGSPHPGDFPNVCLDLDHFLEEYFPAEYELRRQRVQSNKVQRNREGSSSGKILSPSSFSLRILSPIARDCTELVGFDLCGECYNSSLKLPGRFNQQHTPDHRMELEEATLYQRLREEAMMVEPGAPVGALVQIILGNQGIVANAEGPGEAAIEEPVGVPGDMLHIIIDDEGIEDNDEEDQVV
ncbi:hypothetical protein HU200_007470 [Digitaria exilis]|uniref:RING-type domain-containing protein n=1 Tax=Digitaria exilis TaxID=1010633 RepID=A0A835KST0_9POAL|nr:hypothetical protein HU200_007470 [Digitaria exilis]